MTMELGNNNDIDGRSVLQIDTYDAESHVDGRAIFSNIPGEFWPGCNDWDDSLNLAVKEGQTEFGHTTGAGKPQPGCYHWDNPSNHAVGERHFDR